MQRRFIHGIIFLGCMLMTRNSAAVISDKVAEDLTAQLTSGSSATIVCGNQRFQPDLPASLSDPTDCSIELKWVKSVTVDDVTATAKKFVIVKKGSLSPTDYLYEYPLSRAGDSRRTFQAEEWFRADKFVYGEEYKVWIVYSEAQSSKEPGGKPEQLDDHLVQGCRFKPVKRRVAFQLTGKVFSAWQVSGSENRSFIVPGVAAGIGIRMAKDYNDQDVLGLRAGLAAGPNLVPKLETTTDAMGNTTTTTAPQRLQVLTGFELVLARYASIGLMWVPLGGDSSPTPLFLLSYGELYPGFSK